MSNAQDLENSRRVAARFSMAGRKALVTGGSISIGGEIALAFAEAGADVVIQHARQADIGFGRNDAAEEMVAAITGRGRAGGAIDADFSISGEPTRCVEEARTLLGGLDVLVVCASIQYRIPFEEVTADQIERQLQVNFKATIELLQAALPHMRENRFGRILTIGSVNQIAPEPALSVYAALKSAQHNLSFNLAREYAPYGITINNLSPGLIATERNKWRRVNAATWKAIEAGCSPMQRAGAPSEMAGAALLFCSDAGSYITGADLQATGGRHLAWSPPAPACP
ncbi:SDR family NAD(P)-dependent oxidoreductase [Bradyrhizobium mercantei]|uniref:SDR family NAD(P)-dependent oxidoreductase n=1 Tax=Bradyrhizobium mercantei TaxID=1904807 RepID=UPI000977B56A|nr:SDR family oxidoreductase [Bradyrhizobium mercantei]